MADKFGQVDWKFNLRQVSQDKRSFRTSLNSGQTWEAVGVDCSLDGGLRPFSGFKHVVTMSGSLTDTTVPASAEAQARQTGWGTSGGAAFPTIVEPQVLDDIHSFTAKLDADTNVYGFVYRVRDSAATPNVRYFMCYRRDDEATWHDGTDLIGWWADSGAQMDVVSTGKYVYLLRRGQKPVRVSFDESSAGTTVTVVEDTGPGEQPKCSPGDLTMGGGDLFPSVPTNGEEAIATADFDRAVTISGGSWVFINGGYVWIPQVVTANPDFTTESLFGSAGAPQRPPLTKLLQGVFPNGASEVSVANNGLLPGASPNKFEAPKYRVPKESGEGIGATVRAAAKYGVAYRLYDSRTGLTSNVSEVAEILPTVAGARHIGEVAQGPYYQEKRLTYNVTSSAGVEQFYADVSGFWVNNVYTGSYLGIHIVYDRTKWDTLQVYRTVARNAEGVATDKLRTLLLEAEVTLADYHIATQPGGNTYRRAIYYFEKSDDVLAAQERLPEELVFDADPPRAGSGLWFETTMLYGAVGGDSKETGQLNVIRWSDLLEVSPEAVSPFGRYVLQDSGDEVLRFLNLEGVALGWSRNRMYFGYKVVAGTTASLSLVPKNGGYGLTGQDAATAIADFGYGVTNKGIKVIGRQGSLSDLDVFDYVIIEKWKNDLADVQVAYDEEQSVLYVHNPVKRETLLLWFNKRRMSELRDTAFAHVVEASMPVTPASAATTWERRAAFVSARRLRSSTSSAETTLYEWQVFTPDFRRTKAKLTMMDCDDGDVAVNFVGSTPVVGVNGLTYQVSVSFDSSAGVLPSNLTNAYVYVLEGPQRGSKARIEKVSDTDPAATFEVMGSDNGVTWATLAAGTRLGLSPVFTQWVAGPVGVTMDQRVDPYMQDDRQQKRISAIYPTFADVGGGLAAEAFFEGLVFEGNSETPAYRDVPMDKDGNQAVSVADGPAKYPASMGGQNSVRAAFGTYLSPGIRIYSPDVSFLVTSCVAVGSQEGSNKGDRV